jgi:hypothetical protein
MVISSAPLERTAGLPRSMTERLREPHCPGTAARNHDFEPFRLPGLRAATGRVRTVIVAPLGSVSAVKHQRTPKMDHTEPTRVALPRSTWIAVALAALLLLGMLGTLVAVLISLEGTRSEIRTTRKGVLDTDAHLRRVTNQLSPVLSAVAPLTSTSSARTVRRTRRSLVAAAVRVPAIGADTRRAADAAGYIGQSLQDAQLTPTLTAVRGLASEGHQSLPSLARLLGALNAPGPQSLTACTTRLRVGAPAQPGQLGCALRFVPEIRSLLVALRGLNATSTRVQAATLAVLRESLAVQRETLGHVRSLDDKTLGPAPASVLPAK